MFLSLPSRKAHSIVAVKSGTLGGDRTLDSCSPRKRVVCHGLVLAYIAVLPMSLGVS